MLESIKYAVRAGLGLAAASLISIEDESKSGLIVPLEDQDLELRGKFHLIYKRQKFFTKAMLSLVESF